MPLAADLVSRRSAPRALALATLLLPSAARAVDPFEIQVYDATANAPGVPGLELHLNDVVSGQKVAEAPELPLHHQAHITLEPSLGILPWWEVGAYLQSTLLPDGRFEYAGAKLRSKFVTPPRWQPRARLGINVEVSRIPEHYDRDRWGSEVRPMVAWEDESWLFAFNPIVDLGYSSEAFSQGPVFAPALMALRKLGDVASIGIEYYSDLGTVRGFSPWRQQEHYIYEVVNLLSISQLELNAGIGEGLTDASNHVVAKMIVGYAWERNEARPAPLASHTPLRRVALASRP